MSLQRIFNILDNDDDFFKFPLSFGKDLDRIVGTNEALFRSNVGACNISETEKEYHFDFQAPGFNKEEITIDINDNVLQVKGEHKVEKEENDKKYHRKEVSRASFNRSFSLPENANTNEIGASLNNGILQVKVGKKPEKKPETKRINIL